MSQTLVQRPTPVHELSSREIIDVDDLIVNSGRNIADDDDVQFIMHRPSRLSHEPIVIGDSDDDVEIVAGPSRPVPPVNRRPERNLHFNSEVHRPNRRVLFSPSPPPQDNYIPPVPPLPPFARAQPPLRLRPPDIPGLIRPLEQPFAFEQGLHAQTRPRAPSLHHGPREQVAGEEVGAARRFSMSLGGALVAFNRRNQFEPAQPAAPPARSEHLNGWRNILSNFGFGAYRMFFQGPEGSPDPMPRDADGYRDRLEALALPEERQGDRFRLYQWPNVHRRAHQQPPKEEPDYKPSFTHPAKPENGFSNDFVPQEIITIPDEPGPSSGVEAGSILVCAMCLEPLVINLVGPEEEARKRKLFALRCGHILDGKCIDAIMKPPAAPIQDNNESHENAVLSDKGKGKLKAGIPADLAEGEEAIDMAQLNGPPRRNKGKQKAVKPEDEGPSFLDVPAKRKAAVAEISGASTDYVRSRLRPRRGESSTATSPSLLNSILPQVGTLPLDQAVSPDPQRRQSSRGRRRRARGGKGRPRGKGKGKDPVPVVEAVFEWNCPVSTCGHKHKSVCIEGVWKMDGEQGAIAMYV